MPYICYYIKNVYITKVDSPGNRNGKNYKFINFFQTYFYFLSYGQPDDDHDWSKHVADLRAKYGSTRL